jgi:hypothetical protein
MYALSNAAREVLSYRLAARTGLQRKTCREVLAGRYHKYNRSIRLRAAAGLQSIVLSDGGSNPEAMSLLGNIASGLASGFVTFGSNLATHAAKGFVAWATGSGAATGGSEEGETDGGGEGEEGEEEEEE